MTLKNKRMDNKDRIGIIIQARLNSCRLPAKVLLHFKDKPMLLHLIDRLKNINDIDTIVVATSIKKEDTLITQLCDENNVKYVRGSHNNLISRFKKASKKFNLDVIVRLTGDNPLVSIDVIEQCIKYHNNDKFNITSTRVLVDEKIVERSTPKGHSVDVLNCHFLNQIDEKNLTSYDLEHLIPFFYNDNSRVNYLNINNKKLDSCTVDTVQDYYKVLLVK